ncbi:MAG: hypothetical protein J1F68_04340 [Clostridiales bacterium]|nr:hypothetical protein [Clostridiales bacterium]
MAIVKMKRLTLLASLAYKDNIYDALIRTGSVQLKRSADIDSCTSVDVSSEREQVRTNIARVEEAIRYVGEAVQSFNIAHKRDKNAQVAVEKGSFARPRKEIDFDYFLNFGQNVADIEQTLHQLRTLQDRASELNALRAAKLAEHDKLSLYENLPHATTWYHDTSSATVRLCQLPNSELANLSKLVDGYEAVELEIVDSSKPTALVVVVAHNSSADVFEKAAAYGLVKCSLVTDVLPQVMMEDIERQLNGISEEIANVTHDIAQFAQHIPTWKIYVDYLELSEKKLIADGDLQQTASTFVLEGFYPAESEQQVEQAIRSVTNNIVLAFDEIAEDEFAPTLTRNNNITKQFEFVTNSYSVPDYHEVDPNPVMSVFYFIIFGLMVADVGYGLLLLILGAFAALVIKQSTGIKTMLQLFGICGISAIVVGFMFGSFFSYPMYGEGAIIPLYGDNALIPDPGEYPMVMMIISLLFGVVHIMAGIGCSMAVKIKHKQHLAAWLCDFPWIIVFVGFVLAIFNSALDMAAYEPYEVLRLPAIVSQISLYVCLGALAVALIFAGLGSKGILGKVIKSFSSAYGIINYFSDIMSYIRVFGLMLSSAIMGQVINTLSEMIMGGGGIGYVFAAVVLIFAHLFNLVMGLLSVYIHNGRLQYVEFFGKFYTGDGQLFVPFGSDTRYSLVK